VRPSDHDDAQVLDAAAVAQLRLLGEEDSGHFIEELVALFDRDFSHRAGALQAALRASDFARATSLAHTMRGSCVAVGAQRIARRCEEVEERVGREDYVGARVVAAQLPAEYVLAKQALDAEVHRLRGSD
jgi:histidine phosphotransfer protein HptB